MTCPGCSVHFPSLRNKNQLINHHMIDDPDCREHIISCPNDQCNQKFLSDRGLDKHFTHNSACRRALEQFRKASSFASTAVAIPSRSNISGSSRKNSNATNRRDSSSITSTNQPAMYSLERYKNDSSSNSIIPLNTTNMSLLYDISDSYATRKVITNDSVVGQDDNMNRQKRSVNLTSAKSNSDMPSSSMASSSSSSQAQGNNSIPEAGVRLSQMKERATRAEARDMRRYFHEIIIEDKDDEEECDSVDSQDEGNSSEFDVVDEGNVHTDGAGDDGLDNNDSSDDDDGNGNGNGDGDDEADRVEGSISNTIIVGADQNPSEPSSFLVDMKNKEEEEKQLSLNDNDFRTSIKLLNVLISKKISLHRYSDIMEWRYMDSGYKYLTLDQTINLATQRLYGKSLAKEMAPNVSMISLPSGRSAPLVVFNPKAMIYDLLSSPDITCRESMIFDKTSPNPFHVANSQNYGDFDSSTYYTETMRTMNINTEESVLCPIVLYIDELKLDAFGKLALEPVVMSLMIYNRKKRNLAKTWRVIGYMPNFSSLFGSKSYPTEQKNDDYHFCLGKIIDGIRDLQKNKHGYLWDFTFADGQGNTATYQRKLHFPLAYVIGDAKGHDLLCGRKGTHHQTKCVGRDCDALLNTCDDPSIKCNFLRMSKIEAMSKAELDQISFNKLKKNAFSGIWFGSQPYGINGCVPAEPLHQINLGLLERLPASFFMRLSDKSISILDRHVGFTCTYFHRQSDRSHPDMRAFRAGVSNAKRLTGKEKLCRVFCIYLVLLTTEFQQDIVGSAGRRNKSDPDANARSNNDDDNDDTPLVISKDEYNSWVNVFEQTLLLTSWIYAPEHPKVFFKGGRKSVVAKRMVQFMNMYKKAAPRKTGVGLKLVKFHQISHLSLEVDYGSTERI